MLWVFQRDRQRVEFEVSYLPARRSYQVTCRFPSGRLESDQFVSPTGLGDYLQTLQAELVGDGWQLVGAPLLPQPPSASPPAVH